MSDFTSSYDVLLEMIVDGIEAGSVDGLTPEEVVGNIEVAIASYRAFHGDAPQALASLEDTAKAAAERAGKNAGVAPELLYAHILWELQDAAEINRALNMPVDLLRKEVPDEQIEAASQVLKRALSGNIQSKDCDYPVCGCEDHSEPCRTVAAPAAFDAFFAKARSEGCTGSDDRWDRGAAWGWREAEKMVRNIIEGMPRSAASTVEPVAYRWRYEAEPSWKVANHRLSMRDAARNCPRFEEQALYAAPTTPTPTSLQKAQRSPEPEPDAVREIELKVEQGGAGLWYVTSDQIPGLLVAEQTHGFALNKVGHVLWNLQKARLLARNDRVTSQPDTDGGEAC